MRSIAWPLAISFAVLCSASISAPASAGGLPPLASEQDPPHFIDETDVQLILLNRPPKGYVFRLETVVYGELSTSDAVRLEFRQGSKLLAQQRCGLGGGKSAGLSCTYDGKPLTATGAITVNLILIDDQAEKEFLLRQFHVTVGLFPWMQDKHYQILQDDMLGTAFAVHRITDSSTTDHKVSLRYWISGTGPIDNLRCTVDGKKVPDFDDVYFDDGGGVVEVDALVGGQDRRYRWRPRGMTINKLLWGTREELEKRRLVGQGTAPARLMIDMPGAWVCAMRSEGQMVRQFSFTVKDGVIEPSPAQSAPGFPMLRPGVVLVDLRLPAKNSYDERIAPAAMRNSMGYGMPWPKHPVFDAFRKSLPPASGLPDPK